MSIWNAIHYFPMKAFLGEHKGFSLFLLASFLFHSILAIVPPLNGDEALFWEWSRHLDLGYYAHPPMVAWCIYLFTSVFGLSVYSLRLTSIVLHLGTCFFLYKLAVETLWNRRSALWGCVLYSLMPITVILGTAITTDCSLIFFFTASAYFIKKAVIDDKREFWYAAGVTCGGMLLSKFMAVLLFPGLFLFLIVNKRYREQFTYKEPYIAALISSLLFSPFLYWNMNHQWLTFQFNFFVRTRNQGFEWSRPLYFIVGQLMAVSPVVLLLVVISSIFFLMRDKVEYRRVARGGKVRDSLLLISYLVSFPVAYFIGLSFVADVGAHWVGIVFPISSISIIAWLCFDKERGPRDYIVRKKTLVASFVSVLLVSIPIVAVLLFPRLLPDRLLYTSAVYTKPPIGTHYFGWKEVASRIDELRKEWEKSSSSFFLSAEDYSLASMLSFYTPGHPPFLLMNVDEKLVHGKTLLLWAEGKKKIGANTLYIADSFTRYKEQIVPYFEKVNQLPPLVIRDTNGKILRVFYLTIGLRYLGGEPDRLSIW